MAPNFFPSQLHFGNLVLPTACQLLGRTPGGALLYLMTMITSHDQSGSHGYGLANASSGSGALLKARRYPDRTELF